MPRSRGWDNDLSLDYRDKAERMTDTSKVGQLSSVCSMSDHIDQLAAALAAFQAEVSAVKETSINPFYNSKYADLAEIVKAAGPVAGKHGLAVAAFPSHSEGLNTLVTFLMHSSGQFIASEMLLMLPKDDPQGQGSAITYARRYTYQSGLGIVTEPDDDGNQAARPTSAPRSTSNAKGRVRSCNLCGEVLTDTPAKAHEGGFAHTACIENASGAKTTSKNHLGSPSDNSEAAGTEARPQTLQAGTAPALPLSETVG